MKIIGFNLLKSSIERKEKFEGKLEISSNINVDHVEKEEIPISNTEVVKVTFTFVINYKPDFASIEIKGQIIFLPGEDEMKKILKSWKDKQVPEEFKIILFNAILERCNVKALAMENELNLPLHLPMPKINSQK
jgi:hypothetical protein